MPYIVLSYNQKQGRRKQEGNEMYEKLQEREAELIERLDNLEGCEDNPVYKKEIMEIRKELEDIDLTLRTEFF